MTVPAGLPLVYRYKFLYRARHALVAFSDEIQMFIGVPAVSMPAQTKLFRGNTEKTGSRIPGHGA